MQQTRIESPDLRNCEFSEGALQKRLGYQRMHSNILRDSSIRLNGNSQYIRIPNVANRFEPSNDLYITIDCVMREVEDPASATTEKWLISRGYGTGANRYLSVSFDPSLFTGAGGWQLRMRDGANDRAVTIADGTVGGQEVLDQFRHHEIVFTSGTTYTWTIYDSAGSSVGSNTFTVATGWLADASLSAADDWVLGADQNSAGAALADTYGSWTLAEFRIWDSATTPTYFSASAATRVARELDNSPTTTDELTGLLAYYKLNDGTGNTLADSSANTNLGIIAGRGPAWVEGSTLGPGPASLEFFGEAGVVRWIPGGATRMFANIAGGGPVDTRRWGATFVFVPRMGEGESTVRDQTLIWFGTDSTSPNPFGAVIDSSSYTADRLTILYRDGTSVKATTIPLDLSTKVGEALRVEVRHNDLWGGDEFSARITDASGTRTWSTVTATAGTDPPTFSAQVSIGRRMTSSVLPFTYSGNSGRCVISDIAFYRTMTSVQGGGPWNGFPTTQQASINFAAGAANGPEIVMGLPLDDGAGIRPRTVGQVVEIGQETEINTAFLMPEFDDGAKWDLGIVDPFDPPEISGIFDFRRATPTGDLTRSLLVVSGTTLYEVTGLENGVGAATATAVGAGLEKAGKCTFAQLQDVVYIGRPNGLRPKKWDGTYLDNVGIEAPSAPPEGSAANVGGSLDGTYQIYVTYRNASTGVESNPSPALAVTATGSDDAIGTLQIPISPDPQVTSRRVWISPAGQAALSGTIYLALTIDDNVAPSATAGILAVDTSAASISDYNLRTQAPVGSLVETFKDRLWVSGGPLLPTRISYSGVLTPDQFDGTAFLDLDQDTGDRITSLGRLLNRLVTFMRDGFLQISDSGKEAAPFFASVGSRDAGSVGAQGVHEYAGVVLHVGERDIWLWDGGRPLNLTSPTDQERPSIQTTIRTGINTARLPDASIVGYRFRDQLWAAFSSAGATRNDMVLVLDFENQSWSRYDMDIDTMAEVEDGNDASLLYAGIRGFLCLMDSGDADGASAVVTSTATSGTTDSLTDSAASFTVDEHKGKTMHWYDASENAVVSARVRKNSTTALSFYDAVTAPASGDTYVIGGIPWYADFVVDYGNPMRQHKIHWFRAALKSDNSSAKLRVTTVADKPDRDTAWNASGNSPVEYLSTIATTDRYDLIDVGGVGHSFRVRIADVVSSLTAATSTDPMPGEHRIELYEWELEGFELGTQ